MADSNIRKVLVRNTAWNYVGFVVNLASNLLLFPIAVARMGDTATGIWLLIGSIGGYMGLLQLGIAPAVAQFAAMHIARREDDALARTVSTALALVTGLGAVALLALPAVPWLIEAFSIAPALRGDAAIAFTLGIIGVPLQMPGHVFNAVLGAAQRQDRSTQVWMTMLTGKLVGIAALLGAGYGLVAVMWLDTALILSADILLATFAFVSVPTLRLSAAAVDGAEVTRLANLGGWVFLSALCTLLIEQTDRIVIGLFLAVEFVTYYSAAWKLYMLVYSVCTTLVQAVGPLASALYAHGDLDGLQRLWLRMTRYTVAVAWPIAWGLGLCAGPVLRVWVGPAYAQYHGVVQILVLFFLVTAHNHAAFGVLTAMLKVRPLVLRYTAPQALLNLVLSVWLVRWLGITGVALGTLLPAVVLQYTFTSFVLSSLSLPWSTFWGEVVRPTAGPALVAFAPSVVVYLAVGPQSWWLVPAAIACGLLFVALFWRSMHGAERAQLRLQPAGPAPAAAARLSMRIGIDVRYLSHGLVGGVHAYMKYLVPALVEAAGGDQVVLYADRKRPLDIPPPPGADLRLLPWRHPGSSVYNDLAFGRRMSADGIDVGFFPTNYGFGPAGGATVITVHDAINLLPLRQTAFDPGHRRDVRYSAMMTYLHALTTPAVRKATRLVTMSGFSRDTIAAACGRSAADIVPVYHGAPPVLPVTDANVREVRARFGIDGRYVLADGLKNPGVLVRAWARLDPALRASHRALFFARHAGVLPELQAAVDRREATLLVRPSFAELAALYRGAAAFAFPSWIEGFGIPLLEAMNYGAPIVASDRGAIPEVAGDAALFVDAEDDAGLAAALGRVLGDPAEADRLRARGRARVAGFTWQRSARETLAVLRDAAARRGAGGAA